MTDSTGEKLQRFNALYQRYRTDVYRLCARILRDPGIAEDLTQETFVRVFRQLVTLDDARGVWPWLSTIARNLCIDEIRAQAPRASSTIAAANFRDTQAPIDPTWEEVASRDTRKRVVEEVTEALASLRPRERKIVMRKILEGLSWNEIAQLDGSTTDAVRNAGWRARGTLRAILEDVRREVASLGLIPAVLTSWRGFVGRARSRMDGLVSALRTAVASSVVESVGPALVGLGLIGMTYMLPLQNAAAFDLNAPRETRAQTVAEPRSRVVSVPRRPAPNTRIISAGSFSASTPPTRLMEASLQTSPPRDHTAAPSDGWAVVEIATPDGTVIYRGQWKFRCNGVAYYFLPNEGSLRAAC